MSAALLIALGGATSVAAQDREPPAVPTFTGIVVDEVSRTPIEGALVVMEGHRPAALTDSTGTFELSGFERGPQLLQVRQFGYIPITVEVVPPPLPHVVVEIPLVPAPIAVDGIEAVVDRVESMERRIVGRQRAAPLSARTYDQARLARSGALNVFDFLLRQPAVRPTLCATGGRGSGICFLRRGRVISPLVYIDEMPALGGMDELALYGPEQLYLLEVYSNGLEVRAYTYAFMERMAERPMALIPIGVGRR